ncbi:MAG: hypothetical protein IH830_12495 [Planctomycetes bacterium]|nr:hypothetical protein [Planctomycetota bacterium]
MTQQERILLHLQDEPTCGTSFLNWHIPRYAARIHELRAKGHQITSERCKIEYHHHHSPQTVYTLRNHSWVTEDVR